MAVHKRKDTGKYEVRIRLKDGTKYSKSFRNKLNADKHHAKILAEIENGTFLKEDTNISLKKASEIYFERYANIYCKDTSIDGYKGYINNHILPYFNNKPLVSISKVDIEKFKLHLINKKQINNNNKKLSNETINHILFLLGAIFKMMVDDEVIKNNPVVKVKKMPVETRESNFLDSKQAKILLNHIKENNPKYYAIVLTAIITGIRQGELFALTWSDIDLENNILHINKSYSHNRLSTPKTKSSIRDVNFPDILKECLIEYKEKYSTSDTIVFANNCGNYMNSRNFIQRFFEPTLQEIGLPKIKWHELRHSYVTSLLENGVNIKYIQTQTGHSNIKTTLNIYSHITNNMKNDAINALNKIYSL